MKWLTQKHIQAQAAKGPKEALDVSIEHWDQLCNATKVEIARKERRLKTVSLMDSDYCGLCQRYYNPSDRCTQCPLAHCTKANSLWQQASVVYNITGLHVHFLQAARKLRAKLRRLRRRLDK